MLGVGMPDAYSGQFPIGCQHSSETLVTLSGIFPLSLSCILDRDYEEAGASHHISHGTMQLALSNACSQEIIDGVSSLSLSHHHHHHTHIKLSASPPLAGSLAADEDTPIITSYALTARYSTPIVRSSQGTLCTHMMQTFTCLLALLACTYASYVSTYVCAYIRDQVFDYVPKEERHYLYVGITYGRNRPLIGLGIHSLGSLAACML